MLILSLQYVPQHAVTVDLIKRQTPSIRQVMNGVFCCLSKIPVYPSGSNLHSERLWLVIRYHSLSLHLKSHCGLIRCNLALSQNISLVIVLAVIIGSSALRHGH